MKLKLTRRQFLIATAVLGGGTPAWAEHLGDAGKLPVPAAPGELHDLAEMQSKAAVYGAAPFETAHLIPGDKLDLHHVDRKAPNAQVVALTFDDGPDKLELQSAKLLAEYGAKATFFAIGQKIPRGADIARELAAAGHELGCHSFTHPMMSTLNTEQRDREFRNSLKVFAAIDQKPTWFRPPYGDWNGDIARRSRAFGMKTVTWTVDSRDWKLAKADDIVGRVVPNLTAGAVILMHGTKAASVEALPTILAEGKARGLSFVTMNQWYDRMSMVAGV